MLQIVELKLDLKRLQTQIDEIMLDDAGEKRKNLTKIDLERVEKYLDQQGEIVEMIKTLERSEQSEKELREPVEKPVTHTDGEYTGDMSPILPKALKDNEPRNYRNVFNPKGIKYSGSLYSDNWRSYSEFLTVIGKKGYDPRLEIGEKRAMTEGVPHDGGYMIPESFGELIWDPVMEKSVVLSRANIRPMKTNVLKIPAFGIGDHSVNIYDGFLAYWTEELGTLTETTPKVRDIQLNAKKLSIYTTVSNEFLMDLPGGDNVLLQAMSNALDWYLDYYLLQGVGAAQPKGLLNSAAIVSVAKETGCENGLSSQQWEDENFSNSGKAKSKDMLIPSETRKGTCRDLTGSIPRG